MTDCPNGDVRDLLPDLLHDRLDAESRRTVDAHLSSCADCRAELALLADMRSMMHADQAIDVGAIMAALPAAAPARHTPRATKMLGWRTAAAITMLAAGGTSVALLQRNAEPVVQRDSVALVAPAPDLAESSAAAGSYAAPSMAPAGGGASAAVAATAPATRAPRASAPSSSEASSVARPRELALAGSAVGDLTDRELAVLLSHIDALDGVPSRDVESVDLAPLPPRTVRP
jgi:hypothetical protein